LVAGGQVEFMRSAHPIGIWKRLAVEGLGEIGDGEGVQQPQRLSMFMGVPTVYAKMLQTADTSRAPTSTSSSTSSGLGLGSGLELTRAELEAAIVTLRSMRLHVSGSAALPLPVMTDWQSLTGHTLLERYGMTEIG